MDLVYGNDGMNYRVLAKSGIASPRVEQQILNNYMKYYFPENASIYTSPETEPESIVYVTSDLMRTLPKECAIMAKNGRMRAFITPSFYFHAHLEEIDKEYYKKRFFEIFDMEFLSDIEAADATDEFLNSYSPRMRNDIQENALSEHQLKSILYYLFSYERRGKAVKILLDATGDDYNRRSREVLKAVYHYLPYDFRKRTGFVSYMDEKQSSIARVGVELYDRSQIKKINGMDVDLMYCDSVAVRNSLGRKQICDYVDELVEMTEDDRNEHFDFLEQISGGGRLNLQECLEYRENEKSWRSDSVESLLPSWIEYVYSNCMQQSPLYRQMLRIIEQRVDSEVYNNYLQKEIQKVNADLLNIPENIRKIFMFADYVAGIEVSVDELAVWDSEQHQKHVNKNDLFALGKEVERLTAEIAKVENLDLGVRSFEAVKEAMLVERRTALADNEDAYQKTVSQIKTQIDTIIQSSGDDISKYITLVKNSAQNFDDVPELQDYYRDGFGDRLKLLIDEKTCDKTATESDIAKVNNSLESVKNNLSAQNYQYCRQAIDKKLEDFKRDRKRREKIEFYLKERKDLIGLIKAVRNEEVIQGEYPEEGERCMTLKVGDLPITEKLSVIDSICEFLIAPEKDNIQQFWLLISKLGKSRALLSFIESDLFSDDHIPFLEYIFESHKLIKDRNIKNKLEEYIDHKDSEHINNLNNFSVELAESVELSMKNTLTKEGNNTAQKGGKETGSTDESNPGKKKKKKKKFGLF